MISIEKIQQKRIIVLGDIMLDEYYKGTVDRISPEAPVPVFLEKQVSYRLGGAANVAMNLAANNQKVSIMAIIGNDFHGEKIKCMLKKNDIDDSYLFQTERPTTTKIRLIAGNNQQVLRIDDEDSTEINAKLENMLLDVFKSIISGFDLVIISDYMKGLMTVSFTQNVIAIARENNLRVLVDVKGNNAQKYKGAFLIKPNKKELAMLTTMSISTMEEIQNASQYLRNICDSEYVLTTCGADGMVLVNRYGKFYKLKTTSKEVFDVTGAGDTVIAFLGICLTNEMTMEQAIRVSNYAAGIQISKVGTSIVTFAEVIKVIKNSEFGQVNAYKKLEKKELLMFRKQNANAKIVFTNGCFDILHIGHIRYLKEAAALGDMLIVGLNSDDSVRRLKGNDRPINSQEERFELLAALEYIDYIVIFDEDTPYEIIRLCQPDILVKGGDYTEESVIGNDLVKKRGGHIKIIPYVKGKSTTNIISKIQTAMTDWL